MGGIHYGRACSTLICSLGNTNDAYITRDNNNNCFKYPGSRDTCSRNIVLNRGPGAQKLTFGRRC